MVPDNYQYSRLALAIKDKSSLSEDSLPELTEITGAIPGHGICCAAYCTVALSGCGKPSQGC